VIDVSLMTIQVITVRFQEGVLRSFAIYCHYGIYLLSLMMKSEAENAMDAEI
jgi:hypothetical protein